jgi:hypothetical protein
MSEGSEPRAVAAFGSVHESMVRCRLKRLAKPLPQEMARGIIDALFQRPQGSNAPQAVTAGWTRDIAEEL